METRDAAKTRHTSVETEPRPKHKKQCLEAVSRLDTCIKIPSLLVSQDMYKTKRFCVRRDAVDHCLRARDRSVYSNVTVIVVVVVLVCVLCIVSPMISHLFWSLEYLLSDPKSRRIACNYRKKVQPEVTEFFFVFLHTASPCVTTQRLYTSVLLLLQVELFLSSFF